MKNILEQFLEELDVAYTRRFAGELYNSHPHRNNMYGLKLMLKVYGINTIGVMVSDRKPSALTFPCLLHAHGDFLIGLDAEGERIRYVHHGSVSESGEEEFGRIWTGNALIVEESPDAEEPHYRHHRLEDITEKIKAYCLPAMAGVAVLWGIIRNYTTIGTLGTLNLFMSALGLILSFLLLQKQVLGRSVYGDRVCSLLGNSDCGNVLDGPASKIVGISWSEVGVGYFIAIMITVSLFPEASGSVAVVNWLAMPYGVWSIHHQWKVAGSWCAMCVSVQAVVWSTGLVDILWMKETGLVIDAVGSISVCMLVAAGIVITHGLVRSYSEERERLQTLQHYRALKSNHNVAKALMSGDEFYEVSPEDSSIIFGRPDASVRVTILSNPHCNPCARMHKEVESLLALNDPNISVQYIFTSFSNDLDDSSRYLIRCFMENDSLEARRLFDRWYAGDRNIPENTKAKLHNNEVETEMERHRQWQKKSGFSSTPTVLVNGYRLPKEYDLMDLPMIAGL